MKLDEHILQDDYPVYHMYWYVIDGKPTQSPTSGTVQDLKYLFNAKEIKNCDIGGRDMWHLYA